MGYQQDNEGNLYDANGNFLAYNGQYFFDENGNLNFYTQENTNYNQNQNNETQATDLQNPNYIQTQDQNLSQNLDSNLNQNIYQQPLDQNQNIYQEQANLQNQEIQNNLDYQNNYQDSQNQNLSQKKEGIFDKISAIFFKKKVEDVHIDGVAMKSKEDISFEKKFRCEYTFSEDLMSFKNKIFGFFGPKKAKSTDDNAPRWKVFFVSKKDAINMIDQLSTLLNAGIRLIDAMKIMRSQSKKTSVKVLYKSLSDKLANGKHLSEALEDYDYIFPEKWIKLITAAEKSGQMDEILRDLSREEKEQIEFVSKVKGAMIYPGILLFMAAGVFLLMMIMVVPSMKKSFNDPSKLPALTRNVIDLSDYLQANYLLVVTYPIIFFIIFTFLNSQFITVQKLLDNIMLRVPIFGKINYRKNIIIFANNFSLLLSSGVLVAEALKIVAEVVPSPLYKKELHKIRRGVEEGKIMSEMMGLTGDISTVKENFYFPLEVAQMIKIGEETGRTNDILKKISEVNGRELDVMVKGLTAMLEPIITVVIGGIVGTLLMAFMVPMMSSFKNV